MFTTKQLMNSKKNLEAFLAGKAVGTPDIDDLVSDWLEMYKELTSNKCESCGKVQENALLIKFCGDC